MRYFYLLSIYQHIDKSGSILRLLLFLHVIYQGGARQASDLSSNADIDLINRRQPSLAV